MAIIFLEPSSHSCVRMNAKPWRIEVSTNNSVFRFLSNTDKFFGLPRFCFRVSNSLSLSLDQM